MPHAMIPKFEWDNPDKVLAEVRTMLGDRVAGMKAVPERAIRRGTAELLKLVQKYAPKKTSTLVRSLTMVVEKIAEDLVEGRVGTWLDYGRYLEEGTGIFGPKKRAITIIANKKKALYWGGSDEDGDALIRKRVVVKGIKPRGYFAKAIAEFLPRFVAIIEEELAREAGRG